MSRIYLLTTLVVLVGQISGALSDHCLNDPNYPLISMSVSSIIKVGNCLANLDGPAGVAARTTAHECEELMTSKIAKFFRDCKHEAAGVAGVEEQFAVLAKEPAVVEKFIACFHAIPMLTPTQKYGMVHFEECLRVLIHSSSCPEANDYLD